MLSMKTAWGENPALSYRNMRTIIGYVGLTLPVVLLLAGAVDGHIESSLSAYYYTKVGNVFTGALCVIGVFLLAYRLTAWAIDNIATALAGLSALGVAFFHAAPEHATQGQLLLADVHLGCATTLFILLGAISLFIFPRDIIVPDRRTWRANWYMAPRRVDLAIGHLSCRYSNFGWLPRSMTTTTFSSSWRRYASWRHFRCRSSSKVTASRAIRGSTGRQANHHRPRSTRRFSM